MRLFCGTEEGVMNNWELLGGIERKSEYKEMKTPILIVLRIWKGSQGWFI